MQQRHWRKLFRASVLTTLIAWGCMVFGVGVELLPEPDAPPVPMAAALVLWEVLVVMSALTAPIVALVSGYGGWIHPILTADRSSRQ